jgi:hypothetical protein
MSIIVIKMEGGLANQLFQYLFGISLAKDLRKKVFFDISEYIAGRGIRRFALMKLRLPGIFISCKAKYLSNGEFVRLTQLKFHSGRPTIFDRLRIRQKIPTLFEPESSKSKDFSEIQRGYFIGYWLSPDYWDSPNDLLAWMNSQLQKARANSLKLCGNIWSSIGEDACAVHIRRGDYLNPEHVSWHGICSDTYYLNAIDQSAAKRFFFFSDDSPFIKKSFSHLATSISASDLLEDEIDEFLILCTFKNIIISNSTFSYLAALLASNREDSTKVYAPYPWHTWGDASPPYPKNWTRINRWTGLDNHTVHREAIRTAVDVVLYNMTSDDEIKEALRTINSQTIIPSRIILHVKDPIESQLSHSGAIAEKNKVTYLTTKTIEGLIKATRLNSPSTFLTLLTPRERWHPQKLESALELAISLNADVVISHKVVGAHHQTSQRFPFISAPVKDAQTLMYRTVLNILTGTGSLLIKNRSLNPNCEDPLYELALSKNTKVVHTAIERLERDGGYISECSIFDRTDFTRIHTALTSDMRASNTLRDAFLIFTDAWLNRKAFQPSDMHSTQRPF